MTPRVQLAHASGSACVAGLDAALRRSGVVVTTRRVRAGWAFLRGPVVSEAVRVVGASPRGVVVDGVEGLESRAAELRAAQRVWVDGAYTRRRCLAMGVSPGVLHEVSFAQTPFTGFGADGPIWWADDGDPTLARAMVIAQRELGLTAEFVVTGASAETRKLLRALGGRFEVVAGRPERARCVVARGSARATLLHSCIAGGVPIVVSSEGMGPELLARGAAGAAGTYGDPASLAASLRGILRDEVRPASSVLPAEGLAVAVERWLGEVQG